MFPEWISLSSTFCDDDVAMRSPFQSLPREVLVEMCRSVCKNLADRPAAAPASHPLPSPALSPAMSPLLTSGTGNARTELQMRLSNSSVQSVSVNLDSGRAQTGFFQGGTHGMPLGSEEFIQYAIEIVCYALTLDFSEHEIIRDATFIFCDWLTALSPSPKPSVPECILQNPNLYAQRIIKNLSSLFVPREKPAPEQTSKEREQVTKPQEHTSKQDQNSKHQEQISKQLMLCHRALRTIPDVFRSSTILETETWEVLLQMLLSVSDTVLSPPSDPEDFAQQISKRLLAVLFDVWLLACQKSFPAVVYWKTFFHMCRMWRHRLPVVEEWLRISTLLFEKLIHEMNGKGGKNSIMFASPDPTKSYQDWKNMEIPPGICGNDLLMQIFIRFFLLLGNVAEVANNESGKRPPEKLMHMISINTFDSGATLSSLSPRPPSSAPLIFLKAMTGITVMVDLAMDMLASMDAYLDISWPEMSTNAQDISTAYQTHSATVKESLMLQRKGRPFRCENRLPCKGLLYLFGPWLFQASVVGRPKSAKHSKQKDDSLEHKDPLDIIFQMTAESAIWQPGRAEAIGTLCRLYSFLANGETLHQGLLARMGLVLAEALHSEDSSGFVMSSAIRNCHDIFRANFVGMESLLPVLVPALEVVLLQKLEKSQLYPEISPEDLRSAALHILSSVVCLPKYFDLLACQDIRAALEMYPARPDSDTFGSLSYRLLDLLLQSIFKETNPANCMLLLGSLYVLFTQSFTHFSVEEAPEINSNFGHKVYTAITHFLQNPAWQQDNNLSYACLEFLHTSSRYGHPSYNLLSQPTIKMVVLSLCQYIRDQAQRPSRNHSKDLHNKIVLAYQCLVAWMHIQPVLMQDQEVLSTVTEVVEIGLTGNKPNAERVPKTTQHSFQLISTRVRDAAELVLLVLLELIGSNNDPGCFQFADNVVTEEDLVTSPLDRFLYFTIDGTSIMAIHCGPGSGGPVHVVQRSLTCRRAFVFQPVATVSGTKKKAETVEEKPECAVAEQHHDQQDIRLGRESDWDFVAFRNEVPGYSKIEKCKADDMLPTFADLCKNNETLEKELAMFSEVFEQVDREVVFSLPEPSSYAPYKPPSIHMDHHASSDAEAVIVSQFLYHMGLKPPLIESRSLYRTPYTVELDHTNPALKEAMVNLDRVSFRPLDWMLTFYIRKGRNTVDEIVQSGDAVENCSEEYRKFLLSMAWPVKMKELFDRKPAKSKAVPKSVPEGISTIDGLEWCLLSSDVCHELGIVMPSLRCLKSNQGDRQGNESVFDSVGKAEELDRTRSLHNVHTKVKLRSFSAEYIDHSTGSSHPLPSNPLSLAAPLRSQARIRKPSVLSEGHFVVLVVWMECSDDKNDFVFPAHEMLKSLDLEHLQWQSGADEADAPNQSPVEYRLIYVCPAAHDMYEIRLRNMDNNPILAFIPLVNGMIVSHAALGGLIRDCVANMFSRKRLSLENYTPGIIRRRNVIQEITNRFRGKEITEASWGA